MSEYKILILDDHPAVREGLKVILSSLGGVKCTLCETVEQLTNMLSRNIHHDLYVLDIEFPKSDIFPILELINKQVCESKILIYSMHDDSYILSHLDLYKIHGYVSKNESTEKLLDTVTRIMNGSEAFSETFLKVRDKNNKTTCVAKEDVVITDREKQVLYYLSNGCTTQEIAEKLHISYYTAKAHRNHLAKKLKAKNTIEILLKSKKYM